jgi:hypothetical protein
LCPELREERYSMFPLKRFVLGLVLSGLLSALLLCNLGAFAGGHIVLSVVDPGRLALAYWLSGGGFLLTAMTALVYRRRSRPEGTGVNARRSLTPSTWLKRAAVTYCVLLPAWSIVGVLLIRGGVRVLDVMGPPDLVQAKMIEQALGKDRGFLLLERPGEAAMLVVRRSLVDKTVAELTAAGLSVRERGRD